MARGFQVDETLSLLLPGAHELLGVALVVDGLLQQLGLLRRDHPVHELAALEVLPFVVRPVPRERVLGAAERWPDLRLIATSRGY